MEEAALTVLLPIYRGLCGGQAINVALQPLVCSPDTEMTGTQIFGAGKRAKDLDGDDDSDRTVVENVVVGDALKVRRTRCMN